MIKTTMGNFGNLEDLRHYMDEENLEEIEIIEADWWGTSLLKNAIITKEIIDKFIRETSNK